MNEKRYTVNGKVYIQRPLVLGQLKQLFTVMEDLRIPSVLDATAVIAAISGQGPAVSRFLAVVLIPDGIDVAQKDLEAMAGDLNEFTVPLDLLLSVIEDFFGCNPLPSLLEHMRRVAEIVMTALQPSPDTGSTTSAAFWPEETLPDETQSSGDTP